MKSALRFWGHGWNTDEGPGALPARPPAFKLTALQIRVQSVFHPWLNSNIFGRIVGTGHSRLSLRPEIRFGMAQASGPCSRLPDAL